MEILNPKIVLQDDIDLSTLTTDSLELLSGTDLDIDNVEDFIDGFDLTSLFDISSLSLAAIAIIRKIITRKMNRYEIEMSPLPNEEKAVIKELKDALVSTKIGISEFSDCNKIKEENGSVYLKTRFGMQLLAPKGRITKLRLKIVFISDNASKPVYAFDGFPKGKIDRDYVINGQMRLSISNLLQIVPYIGEQLNNSVTLSLEPWFIKIGEIYKARILYSGNFTSKPEWYFEGNVFQDDFEIATILKLPKSEGNLMAEVQAFWEYDPGFFKKIMIASDKKTITSINNF